MIALAVVLIVGSFGLYELYFVSGQPPVINPSPIGDGTGKLWQSLYIVNNDGSHYFANAPKPFNFLGLFGSQTGSASDFKQVATVSNSIYINLFVTGVLAYTVSLKEWIRLVDMNGNTVVTLVNGQTVTKSGGAVSQGINFWITGATLTGQDLQNVLNAPKGNYYYVITLNNIDLTLTVNGQTSTSLEPIPTSDNTLQWLIQLT